MSCVREYYPDNAPRCLPNVSADVIDISPEKVAHQKIYVDIADEFISKKRFRQLYVFIGRHSSGSVGGHVGNWYMTSLSAARCDGCQIGNVTANRLPLLATLMGRVTVAAL
ncbi:hypothetical protein J6590_021096 [Homalodisca vitripennis]|nr:hypothetical protein J6590_021096 [Homalodisca vitripennis]